MQIRIAALTASLALAGTMPGINEPANAQQTAAPADYVANVRQHIAFLDQGSRLATRRSSSDKVRAFAKAEAEEQAATSKDLAAWEAAQPTGGLTSPMVVAAASDATSPPVDSDKMITGRSAAIDRDESTGVLMASPGVIVLPQLAKLAGDQFDDLYEATQSASLKELAGLYEAYSMTGKDPALRALALRELPRVKQRISELDDL